MNMRRNATLKSGKLKGGEVLEGIAEDGIWIYNS
jgi:hypothetical protein